MVTGHLQLLAVLLLCLSFLSAVSAEVIWFDGSRSSEAPAGKLLSDNQGYWGDSLFTGVSYHYESNPSNPPDRIAGQTGTFGRRLLDGRVGGDWHVPVGQNPGRPMVVVFDFQRPCVFTEVDIIATRTPRTSLKVEVGDAADDWRTVFEQALEESPEAALKRALLPEDARGRFMRLSIGSGNITYIDEVLVWGDGEVSAAYPENIAPTYTSDIPPDTLASIPGMKSTYVSVEDFERWRRSLGAAAATPAVWASAAETSPTAAILPAHEALNPPLRLLMARNETESLYLTLTNTSATESLELTVADIELRHNGKPAGQIEARLLVGGALPAQPPKRRLTAEQRLRLMLDGQMPDEDEAGDQVDNAVQILPFFDQGQMLGANMMRRYLTNGPYIADYPRLTLPPGGAAVFMLRVTTAQAPPGHYEGVMAAVTASGERLPLQFIVAVADIALPEIDLWIRTWSNGTGQFPLESETRRRNDVRTKRELGASVWSGLPEPGSKTELFGLTGNTYYHNMGVPDYYIHAGYGNQIQVEDITAEDEDKIVNHIRELVRRAGELGLDYDDWFVEIWDEPQESNVALYGALARIIRETDPHVRIYMNPLFWRPGHAPPDVILEHLSPYYNDLIDVSVPISTLVGDNATTEQLWTHPRFVRAFFLHPPGRAGRQMAWRAFAHDFNGWGYYCYYQPRGNPWDIRTWWELSYTYQMVFPGPQGAIITPLYETMREGWEDYRLLSALRQNGREDLVEELLRDFRQGTPLPELRGRALQAFN